MIIKIYQYDMNIVMSNRDNEIEFSKIMFDIFLEKKLNQDIVDKYYRETSTIDISADAELLDIPLMQLCENVFCIFNDDNRPNGKIFRSMSVGDIVRIDNENYLCCTVGFDKIDLKVDKIKEHENIQHYNKDIFYI